MAVTKVNLMAQLQSNLFQESDKNFIGEIKLSERNRDWAKIKE